MWQGGDFAISGNISGGFFGPDGEYLNGFDNIDVSSGGATASTNISLNAARK